MSNQCSNKKPHNRWSKIEEALRFLDSFETDKKKVVSMQQTEAMVRSNSTHE